MNTEIVPEIGWDWKTRLIAWKIDTELMKNNLCVCTRELKL